MYGLFVALISRRGLMVTDANIRISPDELHQANRSSVELADGSGDFLGTLGKS